jgi:hypothetical protein
VKEFNQLAEYEFVPFTGVKEWEALHLLQHTFATQDMALSLL